MSFLDYSKNIVEEYLGTVAYVDDLIFTAKKSVTPIKLPKVPIRDFAQLKASIQKKEEDVKNVVENKESIQLIPNIDPLVFSNAFAKKGIHCSLLELQEKNENIESIKKTLCKSDVVILDWQMHGDNGESSCDFIKHIISQELNTSLSLKLIVIYTDQASYNEIIANRIIPLLGQLGIDADSKNDLSVQSGHTKVVVVHKASLEKTDDGRISGERLPDVIVEEMVNLTSGLVSNTTLQAVSILRKNTHKLLGIHNKNLDIAYLAHRAMCPNPEDAEELLKTTIVDSIDSLLSYSQLQLACDSNQIVKWLENSPQPDVEVSIGGKKYKFTDVERKKWLKDGYKNFINELLISKGLDVYDDKKMDSFDQNKLPGITSLNFEDKEENLAEFAILTHHKSNFGFKSYNPYLTLGTVIKVKDNDQFYLCIQQKCDSLRIKDHEDRSFLFLPLSSEKGNNPIVFKNATNEYLKLKVNDSNCHNLIIIRFKQTSDGMVMADKESEFTDSMNVKYKWILDLKDSHAQRIANKFAAQLSRVGLDESEWLRRS